MGDAQQRVAEAEPAVGGILVTTRDITERQSLAEAATYRSLHDALTDLLNRGACVEQLTKALGRVRRRPDGLIAVCYIDLDGLKAVNDTLGHAAGDEVLRATSRRLVGDVRVSDTVSRLGGDEFAVVCDPVNDAGEALAIAERIVTLLSAPYDVSGGTVMCGASIGVAVAQLDDTAESILDRADRALYEAKRAGRGAARLDAPPADSPATDAPAADTDVTVRADGS